MPDRAPATLSPDVGPNGERVWYGTANDVHVHWNTTEADGGHKLELFVDGVVDGPERTTRLVDAEGKIYAEETVNYG